MLTFLIENRWVTTLLLGVALVVSPLVGVWLTPRPRLAWAATFAACAGVLAFVLTPFERELFAVCSFEWSLITLGKVELVANLLLFVPVGLFGSVASRRPVGAVVAASAFSILIEMLQALVPALGRSCSTSDWFYNTLGALAGGLVAAGSLRLAERSGPGQASGT